ncbi:MAG: GIY-YIG nuclease family protein [Candidatus Omnitrophica bacterium]|nr:GIY-YIG nuclease family protein [Candidatus Omnitrophota bacterium]
MQKKFYVYIIQSGKDKTFYTGYTDNLIRRIYEHNHSNCGYTKSKKPWNLVWYCVFSDKNKAENFEKYLKSGSGIAFMKKRLINPPKL